jgi:hypothetical protein
MMPPIQAEAAVHAANGTSAMTRPERFHMATTSESKAPMPEDRYDHVDGGCIAS